jgi:hypothetical protein
MKGTITIQDDGKIAETFRRLRDEAKPEAIDELRSTSMAVMGRIKAEMPVDKGRARASWGQWTPGDIVTHGDESPDDAHWKVLDGGLTIEQGSNVPYIKELNEGHSKLRAAGFIDAAFRAGQDMLLAAVNRLLERLI